MVLVNKIIKDPLEVLTQHWGHDSFRDPQEDTINSILSGKDTITFASTGKGKSVMFQVPALCLEGVTLVISPLKSLQKDQVQALVKKDVPAALLNSDTGVKARKLIIQKLKDNTLKLLYVSPETLFGEGFKEIRELLVNVPFIAVDEAHCTSAWSDFRPKYREIYKIRDEWFPDAVMLAVTATADDKVLEDIVKYCGFGSKYNLFKTTFDRPNIFLDIRKAPVSGSGIMEAAALIRENHLNQSGILFCGTQKKTEDAASLLSALGFKAKAFHSKLKKSEKDETQDAFINNEIDIVCATIAFGMGVDHPSVRFIIHLDAPSNFEDYSQQCGRASRDGEPAIAYMLYDKASYRTSAFLIKKSTLNPERAAIKMKKLQDFHNFCSSKRCRRVQLLLNFGEEYSYRNCKSCDICVSK